MAGLYAPLPTLRSHPRGGLRTDRGATWVATPSSQWTLTTYSLPVSRRTHARRGPRCGTPSKTAILPEVGPRFRIRFPPAERLYLQGAAGLHAKNPAASRQSYQTACRRAGSVGECVCRSCARRYWPPSALSFRARRTVGLSCGQIRRRRVWSSPRGSCKRHPPQTSPRCRPGRH